ncbi:MAG: DUF4240 domain-containing protein [Verrucomicrobiales bacterium]
MSANSIDDDLFWQILGRDPRVFDVISGDDIDPIEYDGWCKKRIEEIAVRLRGQPEAVQREFLQYYMEKRAALNTWVIYHAMEMIGYVWRSFLEIHLDWLLLDGRETYDQILADPDTFLRDLHQDEDFYKMQIFQSGSLCPKLIDAFSLGREVDLKRWENLMPYGEGETTATISDADATAFYKKHFPKLYRYCYY